MGATFAKEDSAEQKLFNLITERVSERQLMDYIAANTNYINFKSLDNEFNNWTFAFSALTHQFSDQLILFFISKFPESMGIAGNSKGVKRNFMFQCLKLDRYNLLFEIFTKYKVSSSLFDGEASKFLFKLLRAGSDVSDSLQMLATEKIMPFISVNQIHSEFPRDSQTILLESIAPDRNPNLISFILKSGADPNLSACEGGACVTPVTKAIHYGSPLILKMLLDQGAYINNTDMKVSPFIYAIKHKKNGMLREILKLTKNLSVTECENLLVTSVLNNNSEAFEMVLDKHKFTDWEVTQILNKHFIDAIQSKNFYLVMLFLQVRFNPLLVKDSNGKTAWEYMKENNMSNLYLHEYETVAYFDKNDHLTDGRGNHYNEFLYEIDMSESLEDDMDNILFIVVTGDHILEKVFSRLKITSLLHPENYMFSCPKPNSSGVSMIDNTQVYVRILILGNYIHIPIKFFFKIINDKIERRYVIKYEKTILSAVNWDDIDMTNNQISYKCRPESIDVYNVYLTRQPFASNTIRDWETEHHQLTL